jgi:DNA-binding NtrC family response regulator
VSVRILVADDDDTTRELFAEVLEGEGYEVKRASSGQDALAAIRSQVPDLLIVDVKMPGLTGLEVTRTARSEHPEMPVIVITAFGSFETAVEAIHEGAFDFISKPMNLEALKETVKRALAQRRLALNGDHSRAKEEAQPSGTLIGKSPTMVEVYKTIARAAPSHSTVLIMGESGTGKELIARAIHEHSTRAGHSFVAVDCGALTETILASELFGHTRGAFTGAVSDKKGVFEEAQGGTCFLDEIGNLNLNTQSKLLRVLQEHEIKRVGSTKAIKIDARVIAATNKNLEELVKRGEYRDDLFYRLNVVTIRVPPLRERREDIPALARHFLRKYEPESGKKGVAISHEAMQRLTAYSWPGNVRELENVIERAIVLSREAVITPEDLPAEIRNRAGENTPAPTHNEALVVSDLPSLDEVKRRYLHYVLSRCSGNMSRAAKTLNIDRRSLYRMLLRYKNES